MNPLRVAIVAILATAVAAGIGMYYVQVYAFYDEILAFEADYATFTTMDGTVELLHPGRFQGIDSESSPIRFRACFESGQTLEELDARYQPYDDPRPPNAPFWFECFDARAIGEALAAGEAHAYLGEKDVQYGIDRVMAVTPDGRVFAWHQINECGEVVFDGQPAPEGCPPPPERE